jgi:trehalose-6-phosphate synthase
VLVLSEGAGSYQELGEHAVQIHDPRDVDATVRALESALDMSSEERAARAESLRKTVASSTPDQWIADQLEDLIAIKEGNPPATPPP